jgi:predicted nucleic acid-binding Zn ribbon protein
MIPEWCTWRAYLNAWAVELSIESIMDTMPKYDYECPGEEIVIEYSLPILHSNPLCQTCGAVMRQVYQATPAIFKGKGWGSKP